MRSDGTTLSFALTKTAILLMFEYNYILFHSVCSDDTTIFFGHTKQESNTIAGV